MKWFPGLSAAAMLLLCVSAASAGPIGAVDVLSPGASEYRVDAGGGFFHQGRKLRGSPGRFNVTREEVYGTLGYTGYDWSVAGRLGGASFNEEAETDGASRSHGFQPMVGIAAKALMYANEAGTFGVGATAQLTHYMTDAYDNYLTTGLAITAQQKWSDRAIVYGGPYFSYGSGKRTSAPIDNTGRTTIDYVKETPLFGLCAGLNLALPKRMIFEVEGQYTGLTGGNGFSAGLSEWGVGASLRVPF